MPSDDYIKGQEDLINEIKDGMSKILDEYKFKKENTNLLIDIINLLRKLEPTKK